MAPTGLTFEAIHTWAARDFPDAFQHLPDAKTLNAQFNIIRGYNHGNNFKSLVIGTTYTKTSEPADLIAWLAGNRINVGYIGKDQTGKPQVRQMVLTKANVASWNLKFPFNSIPPTQSDTEVACFDAVLRYYFLAKGWSKGVIDDSNVFHRFVARFPLACKAVANSVAQRPGPNPKSHGTVFPQKANGVAVELANNQPLYPQRSLYLFEQIANDPVPSQSFTVLSSPSPSPPPIEDQMTPQALHSPLDPQARSRSTHQACHGQDQMATFDGSNERDESGLQNNVFDLNIRLRDAETAVRKAQEEAQLWRKRYEEAEFYKIKYEEIRERFGPQDQVRM